MKHAYIALLMIITAHQKILSLPSLSSLSLEEKVGQLLMVHTYSEQATPEAAFLIQKLHVGGIIYYSWANGLTSREQVTTLSNQLQDLALAEHPHIPLIIAIDHEGGRVHRFKEGFTHFPPAYAYALCNDPALTEQCATAMGKELQAAGITMNLAPVADIMSNPDNPIIGIRSCGTTPEMVITHAGALLNGFHQAGIATSLKHFPGHGDTTVDSHLALPILTKTYDQLKQCELAPFYALAPYTDTVMTAHLMVPELDAQNCATLSSTILGLLHTQANFHGPIMTDSLTMGAITATHTNLGQAAINAFNAGCDILLVGGKKLIGSSHQELSGGEIATVHQALVEAVHSGCISEQRLDSAVEKILTLKSKYPLPQNLEPIDYSAHQRLASTVTTRALKALAETSQSLPSTVEEKLVNALHTIKEMYEKPSTT